MRYIEGEERAFRGQVKVVLQHVIEPAETLVARRVESQRSGPDVVGLERHPRGKTFSQLKLAAVVDRVGDLGLVRRDRQILRKGAQSLRHRATEAGLRNGDIRGARFGAVDIARQSLSQVKIAWIYLIHVRQVRRRTTTRIVRRYQLRATGQSRFHQDFMRIDIES